MSRIRSRAIRDRLCSQLPEGSIGLRSWLHQQGDPSREPSTEKQTSLCVAQTRSSHLSHGPASKVTPVKEWREGITPGCIIFQNLLRNNFIYAFNKHFIESQYPRSGGGVPHWPGYRGSLMSEGSALRGGGRSTCPPPLPDSLIFTPILPPPWRRLKGIKRRSPFRRTPPTPGNRGWRGSKRWASEGDLASPRSPP